MANRKRTFAALAAVCPFVILLSAMPALANDPPPLVRVQTISLKGPSGRLDHLALDAAHARLFVANMPNHSLDVVDLRAGKLVRQIPGQDGIQGLAYAPELDRIFVGNAEGGICNVFNGRDYRLLKSLKFADDADNVRYDPRTGRAYVEHAEASLAVLDAKSLKVIADIKLPGAPESFQLEKNRPRLYINTPPAGRVAAVDTERNRVVAEFPLTRAAANFPMALDEADHRIFVGCRRGPMLVVLDSESGKEVAGVPIPGDTDDVFFDARRRRIYASCGAGYLAVIRQRDADHYEAVAELSTAKLARTSFFDPDADRLYLVVPCDGQREGPEIWVYEVRS
jgi:DNA-binding beta-propeller fold protein YncE